MTGWETWDFLSFDWMLNVDLFGPFLEENLKDIKGYILSLAWFYIFIHSFVQHLFSTYYMLGTEPNVGRNRKMNNIRGPKDVKEKTEYNCNLRQSEARVGICKAIWKSAWCQVNAQKMYAYSTCTVHFSTVTQSCPTLCDPMMCSTPGLPVHHQLLEFTQTHVHRVSDAIQPFHPLSSPSPPAPNPSQHQSLFQWVNSSHEVAKVLEFQLQHQSF